MPAGSRAATYRRRRKRRMAKVAHDLTAAQWVSLTNAWGGCAYCAASEVELQKDCLLPISRGGRYTLSNVVPACGSCNASKCNLEVTTWMRRKRLDERAFLSRHLEISRGLAAGSPTWGNSLDPGTYHAAMSEDTSLPKIGAPATRALNSAGYRSLADLDGVSRTSLSALHGVGPRAIRILDEAMAESSLSLTD